MLVVPIRLIAGGLCFLYLVLPIVFVPSIREVLNLSPINPIDYIIGSLYSLFTFIFVLLIPREIVINGNKLDINRDVACALTWLIIFLSIYFFGIAINEVDTSMYLDKGLAHTVYEDMALQQGLRLKYNVLLVFFLMTNTRAGMPIYGVLFFLPPAMLEVGFAKHNYATHLLTYLFIFAWNSKISRKNIMIAFAFAVIALLGIRFTIYASFQIDAIQSLAVMLGEFTISWQSIPAALGYAGDISVGQAEWYSDALTRAAGLDIGLAGNPVAEAVFYFGDGAGLVLLLAGLGFVLVTRFSSRSFVGGISMLVTIYYMRDCFRTGWSLGFAVFLKSLAIYTLINIVLIGLKFLSKNMPRYPLII
jgi:hypothetical protein